MACLRLERGSFALRHPSEAAALPQHRDLGLRHVLPFLAISFGLAWGIFALFALLPERMTALFGPVSARNPLFFLAVYAPAIAAVALVLAAAGPRGLARYAGRLLLWRAPAGWILWVVVGIPAVYVIAALWQGAPAAGAEGRSLGALLSAMGVMLVLGPVEEFGWRGVLQPLLQRRLAPLWAGTLVGLIWGVWHLPAFLLSGTPQSG